MDITGFALGLPPSNRPSTKVEISVSCRNLKDKDVMSKSDPLCLIFVQDSITGTYEEVGRTEIIKNELNPDFVDKFILDYYFEERQNLKFAVYDADSSNPSLKDADDLGNIECSLGQILSSRGSQLMRDLSKKKGLIIITGMESSASKEVATLQFKAEKLDKKDVFGKSDPFLVISKENKGQSWTVCHTTEYIPNTLKPTWEPITLPLNILCNADYDRKIKIECYDYDSTDDNDLIGEFTTTFNQLLVGPGQSNIYECINPKKMNTKRGYKNSGLIHLLGCKTDVQHTFLDYISGGTQLHFTVAIDFTASNGNPQEQDSLHYMNPYQPNQYVQAIQAVGSIIENYDSDKLFPVLGFGARVPPQFNVSHEFFVNLHPSNPYCQGVAGIVQAYQQSLLSVQLYGPTNFSPVINHVASRFAVNAVAGSHYYILLIITDGVITDMEETEAAIIHASRLPMSIIIVGVGDADFSEMEELDSDKKKLKQYGESAERDIVQFVPFNRYQMTNSPSDNIKSIQKRLAKDVLGEVPNQLVSYMRSRNIQPQQHLQSAT